MSGILANSILNPEPANIPAGQVYCPLTDVTVQDQYGILIPTIGGGGNIVKRVTGIDEEGQLGFLTTDANGELVAVRQYLDIDFLLIRYSWTSEGGRDLDTRTWVNDPAIDFVVGWSRGSSDAYITWGGDNTGSNATEAVLVDFKKVLEDYPTQEEISVRTGAFWYSSRGTGDITMSMLAYKGGTMSHVGTDFVNVGGELVASLEAPRNVELQTTFPSTDGDFLGYAKYNIVDKTFTYSTP